VQIVRLAAVTTTKTRLERKFRKCILCSRFPSRCSRRDFHFWSPTPANRQGSRSSEAYRCEAPQLAMWTLILVCDAIVRCCV
jgi:hypothetical protein